MIAGVIASAQMIAAGAGGAGPWKATLTIPSGTVSANLTNYPVMVRLSDMPAGFWAHVREDGGDLQVKTLGGALVPMDLARFDYASQDGVLFFLAASLLAAAENTWEIHYGDPSVAPIEETVTPLTVSNPGADTDTTGWTNTTGAIGRRTTNPLPYAGAGYFFGGTVAETRANQTVAIPADHHAGVDAGERRARLRWRQASSGGDADAAEMEIEFLDGASGTLGGRQGAGLMSYPDQTWRERVMDLWVPATARSLRVSQHMLRATGTNSDGYIDAITLELVAVDPVGAEAVWREYEAVLLFGEQAARDRTGRGRVSIVNDPDCFEVVATSPDLDSHQGVCWDGTHYYTSDTGALKKWDAGWNLVAQNTNIFAESGIVGANHLGDIDVHDGVLYGGMTGTSTTWITKWDAATLAFLGKFEITTQSPTSAAAVCVRPDTETVFLASFVDGAQLWEYALDGTYLGELPLSQTIVEIQGITWWRGAFWINSDSTDATYRVTPLGVVQGEVFHGPLASAYEGCGHTTDALLVLVDTGSVEVVQTCRPRDDALSAGGGIDFVSDSRVVGTLARAGALGTQWSMACTFAPSDNTARNVMALGASGTGTSQTVSVFIQNGNTLTCWDSSNTFLAVSPTVDPALDVAHRVNVVYSGTSARHIYYNGANKTTDPTITARGTGAGYLIAGNGVEGGHSSPFRGTVGFAYCRPGILSDAWIAAEYANLNAPGTFVSIGAEEAV